ncbi:hypothetical protein IAE22_34255, partial [Bacillus sp. S34]|nr:hypothetical protein [Bacillus sp. S34]
VIGQGTLLDDHSKLLAQRKAWSATDDPADLSVAAASIAASVRSGLGKLSVERVDGAFVLESPLGAALREAGFTATPQGVRLRV